jgi:hypothetical protein
MHDAEKHRYSLVIAVLLVALLWTPVVLGIGPYGVIVWEHSPCEGKSLSWSLEPTMRHKLIPVLPEDWNDVISSIEVGSEVKVAVYQHANFCGRVRGFDRRVDYLDWWNDEISSLIIFPKTQSNPLGVELRGEQFYAVTGYDVPNQFFPLPEDRLINYASYPVFGDYMNDEAKAILVLGDNIKAELFEWDNFQGHHLLLPQPDNYYYWYGDQAFDLADFWGEAWNYKGRLGWSFVRLSEQVSSLKVWTGPTVTVHRAPPAPTRHRAPPAS